MRIVELRSLDDLAPYTDAWEQLCEDTDRATPFDTPAWLLPYARIFVEPGWLRIFAALNQVGALESLFPFYEQQKHGHTRLLLLGTGVSDYLNLLARTPGHLAVSSPAVFEMLAATLEGGAVIELQELPGDIPLPGLSTTNSWTGQSSPQSVCPVLELNGANLSEVVPREMLQNVRFYQRRLARHPGGAEFVEATSENFEALFERLIELHTARRGALGDTGAFADEKVRAFHREAARGLIDSGWLRLFGLRLGSGKIVAVYYGMLMHGRAFFYLSGFDPHFSQLSPGTLLIAHAIESAMAEGAGEFHFLRGAEPYKYRWGATDRQNHKLVLTLAK